MNKYIIIFLFLILSCLVNAQTGDFETYRKQQVKAFNEYAQQKITDFEKYRNKRNVEFSRYLGEKWEKVEIKEGEELPIPKPLPFPYIDPNADPIRIEVPQTIPLPKAPKSIELIVKPFKKSKDVFDFDFYGLQVSVRINEVYTFQMKHVDEKSVQAYWSKFSSFENQELLDDCVRNKKQLNLSDWAYVQFINKLTATYYGGKNRNEAVFLQGYLLTQSGYDVRFISEGDQLILGAAIDNPVFGISYIPINNRNYYLISYTGKGVSFYTFRESFSEESQALSMVLNNEMEFLPFKESEPVNYFIEAQKEPIIQTVVNSNLIEFYNDYPQCEWNVYARCPMSTSLKKRVLPSLFKLIQNKTKRESANILIDFVQKTFKYSTDNEQFGYEKPFFIDEIFYYPASDCEDRAVLFSYLVRELVGLDVVLLHYPNHLCTAVLFDEEIEGDALVIGGKRYLICDPTFVGASIGYVHNDYKSVKPQVYTIE